MFSAACAEIALPAIYQVTGISSDDALNVRSGPSTGYPAIGGLQNGAQVEVTADTGEGWARILHGEGNGWVAMRYLQPLPASAMPDTLFCGGTEPFWSLTLEPDGSMVFTEAGQQSQPIPPDWRHGVRQATGEFRRRVGRLRRFVSQAYLFRWNERPDLWLGFGFSEDRRRGRLP